MDNKISCKCVPGRPCRLIGRNLLRSQASWPHAVIYLSKLPATVSRDCSVTFLAMMDTDELTEAFIGMVDLIETANPGAESRHH
jgi:hypothetical protein